MSFRCLLALALAAFSLGAQAQSRGSEQNSSEVSELLSDLPRAQRLVEDWPQLSRYHDANARLPPPVPGEMRVVFLAGTNDIAGNTGPTTLEAIEDNLISMSELAKANQLRVVLASLLPVCDLFRSQTQRRPPEKIEALNGWLKDYAVRNGFVYLDYYSAMIDDKKTMRRELTYDCLHPNEAGYEIMAPLAEK